MIGLNNKMLERIHDSLDCGKSGSDIFGLLKETRELFQLFNSILQVLHLFDVLMMRRLFPTLPFCFLIAAIAVDDGD